jgi:glycosyltransferase involved in cell wall biosynthesis
VTGPGSGEREPRVALLHYTFPSVPGGVERVLARHARALAEAGAQVLVLAGRGNLGKPVAAPAGNRPRRRIGPAILPPEAGQGPAAAAAARANPAAIRIPLLDSRHPRVVAANQRASRPADPEFEALVAELEATLAPILANVDALVLHNVTTCHFNLALTAALHRLASRLAHRRWIVWIHDLSAANPRYASLMPSSDPWPHPWALLRQPLPGALHVTVSIQRQAEAARLLGLAPEAIRVVPNGVDPWSLLRLRPSTEGLLASLGAAQAYPILLVPARLTPRKRIEVVIDALTELRRDGLDPLLLVTAAPDPHSAEGAAYADEIRRRAGADPRIVLLGDRLGRLPSERLVAELYAIADVVVVPSESEGFGLPVAEAAVLRRPIVCSDLPAHRAILGEGATYVSPQAEPDELAAAVETALQADWLGRRARQVANAFHWEGILAREVVPLILGRTGGAPEAPPPAGPRANPFMSHP